MRFDPDKAFVKHRGLDGVWFEQDGQRFNSGLQHIGPINAKKPKPKDPAKDDVRERARQKIAKKKSKKKTAKKKGNLDGYRQQETPDAVSSAVKEDEAARRAEEHA